jgi:hypothetical protein
MEVSFSYVVFAIVIIIMLSYYSYQQTIEKRKLQKQLDGDIDSLAMDDNRKVNQAFSSTDVINSKTNNQTEVIEDVNNTTFMSL